MIAGRARLRVVVAENEGLIRLAIEEMLRELGHQVVGHATTAADAAHQAEITQPDIVLMDIHLDGPRNGIDAAREIKSRLQIPCLFVTAVASPKTRAEALAVGGLGYLLKPVSIAELGQALSRVEGRQQSPTDCR